MTEDTEMLAPSAIAHRSQLAIFRTLIAARPDGLPAAEISAQLGIVPFSPACLSTSRTCCERIFFPAAGRHTCPVGPVPTQAAGFTLWLSLNILAGSYVFLIDAKRS
jgi:hypothetical protein